jgi:hypothetical protein
MSAVPDMVKASIDLANDSYKAGYDAGREIGFNEGLQAAQELIAGKAPEQIILERRKKLEAERA